MLPLYHCLRTNRQTEWATDNLNYRVVMMVLCIKVTQPFGMLKTYSVIVLTVVIRKHVNKNKLLCQLNAELWPHVFRLNNSQGYVSSFLPKVVARIMLLIHIIKVRV